MNRRQFIGTSTLASLALAKPKLWAADNTKKLPINEAFDREIESFMSTRKVPGGALAVMKDGRLVYVNAYGFADREKQVPVKPDSLFRIASVSKPITAV